FRRIVEIAQLRIECIELEEIPVSPDRGTWTTVSLLLPIVAAILRSGRQATLRRVFSELCSSRRNVVRNPVHIRALWVGWIGRIRIIDDECETFRARRHVTPSKRR